MIDWVKVFIISAWVVTALLIAAIVYVITSEVSCEHRTTGGQESEDAEVVSGD